MYYLHVMHHQSYAWLRLLGYCKGYFQDPFEENYDRAKGNWIPVRVNPMVVLSKCTNKGEYVGIKENHRPYLTRQSTVGSSSAKYNNAEVG